MTPVADWIARRVWWGMLWLMRRRWMRALQARFVALAPTPAARERAKASMRRQDQFARRHGLVILRWAILVALYIVALQIAYAIVVAFLVASQSAGL